MRLSDASLGVLLPAYYDSKLCSSFATNMCNIRYMVKILRISCRQQRDKQIVSHGIS